MLDAYSVDTITLFKWLQDSQYGDPSYSAGIEVKGYIEYKTQLVTDIKGEDVLSPVRVYMKNQRIRDALSRDLLHQDRVMLDGESYDRPIVRIDRPKHFSHSHYEIFLR